MGPRASPKDLDSFVEWDKMYGFGTLMAHQEAEGAAYHYRPLGCEGSSLNPTGLGWGAME